MSSVSFSSSYNQFRVHIKYEHEINTSSLNQVSTWMEAHNVVLLQLYQIFSQMDPADEQKSRRDLFFQTFATVNKIIFLYYIFLEGVADSTNVEWEKFLLIEVNRWYEIGGKVNRLSLDLPCISVENIKEWKSLESHIKSPISGHSTLELS